MGKRMIIENLRLKIVDPIECPFCGKEEEDWKVDCPHFIGYENDNGVFDWTDDFKILDEIIWSINKLYSEGDWEVDWKEIFKGVPYWEGLSDEEMQISFDILDNHPFIKCKSLITEVPPMATIHKYIFIDKDKKEEFLDILMEVNGRLNKLLQDEERKMGKKNR